LRPDDVVAVDRASPPAGADARAQLKVAALLRGWVHLQPGGATARFRVAQAPAEGETSYEAEGARLDMRTGAVRFAVDGALLVALLEPRADSPSAQALLARWRSGERKLGAAAGGCRGVVAIDLEQGRVYLATDRFATAPLSVAEEGGRLAFSDRVDAIPLAGSAAIAAQALARYVYFHCLPAPGTIYGGVRRLRAAEELEAGPGGTVFRFHWTPAFVESRRPFSALKEEFLRRLRNAVRRELREGETVGSFLSGGTDSSTVTGLLAQLQGGPVRAYSIGFDADGYDEMAYARIAARRFGVEHRTYYVTPDDLVRSIPQVAAAFDQPFGNSSALPGYYCARLAHSDGITRILAGDGGDELFGGNSRYAKQKIFDAYERLPRLLRAALLEPLLLGSPLSARLPLVRKARSYVEQAKVPMPARMQTYNLLRRIGPENLFTAELLRQVDLDGPAREQVETYARAGNASLVNRMLAYDWQYTLADSDLPKVCGTTAMAGLAVGFPMLDDDLVDFSLQLRSSLKVRGLRLRHFFKEALRGFLPDEILRKSKHGFGLPFGVWLTRHPGLQALVHDAMGSLAGRGFLRPEFLKELDRQVATHAAYYGELVWILTTLEHWLRVHAPDYRLR
jgi:asparagine synthase (glutamine-hydrolysing)